MKKPRKPALDYPRTIAVLEADIINRTECDKFLEELNDLLSSVTLTRDQSGIRVTARAPDTVIKEHKAALEQYERDLIEWKKFQLKKLQAEVEGGSNE